MADCTCAAGYYGPAGGPCEPCPLGTYKDTRGSAAECTACPRSGQWSPQGSDSSSNCIFKASGFAVVDYHGNILYNLTDEFVSFDSHGNQRWTLVPMDGEGSWEERWQQHQDRVEGWEAEPAAPAPSMSVSSPRSTEMCSSCAELQGVGPVDLARLASVAFAA